MNQYWYQYLNQFDSIDFSPQSTQTTTKYCVIVEPRVQEVLPLVIKNFVYLLGRKGWGCIIFHGTENETYLKTKLHNINTLIYHNLGVANLTLKTYNQLLTSTSFWQTLIKDNCHNALIFQSDTVLLKDTVDQYLEYDYIGAPWRHAHCLPLGIRVGNGGLSLRQTHKMMYITMNCKNIDDWYEDIYFSFWSYRLGYRMPTTEIAKTFSVETMFYRDPMGMHKPHLEFFTPKEIEIYNRFFTVAITTHLDQYIATGANSQSCESCH